MSPFNPGCDRDCSARVTAWGDGDHRHHRAWAHTGRHQKKPESQWTTTWCYCDTTLSFPSLGSTVLRSTILRSTEDGSACCHCPSSHSFLSLESSRLQ